jgi:hypothetical protein
MFVLSLCSFHIKKHLLCRFFDRIARIYRNERWFDLLKGVLESWFECVMGLGERVEEGVKVLLELIALGGSEIRVDDLMGLLKVRFHVFVPRWWSDSLE